MRSLDDILKIVASTSHWFVLGRAHLALERFQEGLSAHGVLTAMKEFPDTFHPLFCYTPEVVTTAESLEGLFTVETSPVGSTKTVTESLVLSRWSDYLQDIEDGEDSIHLSDILFFATGCRTLRSCKISPTIELSHEPGKFGHSRFPNANTCSASLRLPVIHESYEPSKADISFGIPNGQGFGSA